MYGYNSSPYFNQVKDNWENFYVLGMTLEWCPSNAVGTQNVQNGTPQSVMGPFLFSDDPDNYSQNAYDDTARINRPSYELKQFDKSWKIRRPNLNLYTNGKLPAADTSASNPYYALIDTNPFVGASLGMSFK